MQTLPESATALGAERTCKAGLYPPIRTLLRSLIADVGSFTFVQFTFFIVISPSGVEPRGIDELMLCKGIEPKRENCVKSRLYGSSAVLAEAKK